MIGPPWARVERRCGGRQGFPSLPRPRSQYEIAGGERALVGGDVLMLWAEVDAQRGAGMFIDLERRRGAVRSAITLDAGIGAQWRTSLRSALSEMRPGENLERSSPVARRAT